MSPRIPPANPPFSQDIQTRLDKMMPKGMPPLALFATLARDSRLFHRFMDGGLLDQGHLTLRQRELVIDRITALSGSEYEWGVHVMLFAKQAGISKAEVAATVRGGSSDLVWGEADRVLLAACEQLHETCTLDDEAWTGLAAHYSEEAILEILMLCGFYRTVSYLTNALKLPLERFGARFPAAAAGASG
jgi:alkylhydroperoxidase family enzyme